MLHSRQGYYYTCYSLLFLFVAAMGPSMPIGLFNRLWYYFILLLSEVAGIYFLVTSAWHWVKTNSG